MIVTIDGPAGAGKSTVARALAKRLGFYFLDTGAMYRAVAWAAKQRDLGWDDPARLVELARGMKIDLTENQVFVDGQDVTQAIRTADVTEVTHHAASNPGVREHLVNLQRELAAGRDIVTEGRDQGTVAFPQADCKVYLTASPEERARRRLDQMRNRGENAALEEVLQRQNQRDHGDATRSVGPLMAADDAVEISTDGLTRHEVVDKLEALVRERQLADRQ